MDQGLLTKNPALTQEQFSHHWFHKHAQLVIPFFLHSGITHYEQIHGPLTPTTTTTSSPLDLPPFSGAVTFPPTEDFQAFIAALPKWKRDYYEQVILVDEKRFLDGLALDCIVRVAPGSVLGVRKVVIEGGKALVEVGREVWGVWEGFLGREGEEKGEGGL